MPQIYIPASLALPIPAVSATTDSATDRPIKPRATGSTYANGRFTSIVLVSAGRD